MKTGSKILSCLLSAVLISAALPLGVSAAEEKGQVRVIVENNTYSVSDGAAWDGTLVDEWVDINSDSTAADIISAAVTGKGYADPIGESEYGAYISEVNGLVSGDGDQLEGSMYPGWMFAVDDWYGNNGVGSFSVQDGSLSDGDELVISYSLNMGADLGMDFYGTSTALKSIDVTGELEPEFKPELTEYTLKLPENTDSVYVVPAAENKNFKYQIYKNSYTPGEASGYKSTREIPVSNGDVIYIGVGNSNWQYVSDGVKESVYKLTVDIASADPAENPDVTPSKPDDNPAKPTENPNKDISLEEIIASVTEQVTSNENYASAGNEWDVLTLARLGKLDESAKAAYIASAEEYLKDNELTKATDSARFTIALTALGIDASDFAGKNLTAPFADFDYVTRQGINGTIFSLIALDTNNYEIAKAEDEENQTTREKLIDELLSAQLPDGGWTFYGDIAEPDLTGMVIEALAPYYDSNEKVKIAVDKAIGLLSSVQNEDGTYTSYGAANSECSAQVVTALSALGIDADKDERFVKSNGSALDGLKFFYISEDKGFSHAAGESFNKYANNQAYYALCAYSRFLEGKTALYDMSDVFAANDSDNTPETPDNPVSDHTNPAGTVDSNNSNNNNNSDSNSNSDAVPTGDSDSTGFIIIMAVLSSAATFALRKKKSED